MTTATLTDSGKNFAGTFRAFELRFAYGASTVTVRRFKADTADAPALADRLLLEAGLAVVEWQPTRSGGFVADQLVRANS